MESQRSTPDSDERTERKMVLWDFDGPINSTRTAGTKETVSIDNVAPLKATLEILNQNNVVSLIASQRTTYGFATEYAADLLDDIKNKKNISPVPEEERGNWKERMKKAFEGVDKNYGRIIIPLLHQVAFGEITSEDALKKIKASEELQEINKISNEAFAKSNGKLGGGNYDDPLTRIVAELRKAAEEERILSTAMYRGLDEAFGKNRKFLQREDAEGIGKVVAFRGVTTSQDKFTYAVVAKETVASCREVDIQKNSFLIDDRKDYEENFAEGNFVHAPRAENASPIEDNLYLGQILLKTIPRDKLFQALDQYPDKNVANELRILVVEASAKKIEEELKNQPSEEQLGKLQFKNFILDVISKQQNTLDDALFISQLISHLEDPRFDNLLRLETGGHLKVAELKAKLLKEEVEKYGMTGTWAAVISAAKNRVDTIIKAALKRGTREITQEQDEAIRKLYSIETGRMRSKMTTGQLPMISFLAHDVLNLKPTHLRNYEKLIADGSIVIQSPKGYEKKQQ